MMNCHIHNLLYLKNDFYSRGYNDEEVLHNYCQNQVHISQYRS